MSTPAFTGLFQPFDPDNKKGLARLIELIVRLHYHAHRYPIAVYRLISAMEEIKGLYRKDMRSFIFENCPNISVVEMDGMSRCILNDK